MAIITSTSICNEALVFLGEEPMLTFPETSEQSDRCEIYYDRVKASELSKHQWNFALQREALTRESATPAFEYQYQFVLPAKCLRVLDTWPKGHRWKREGDRLLTYTDTVSILYIKNVDEGVFTPAFAAVMSARLAVLLASTLTERVNKLEQAAAWYEDALSEARRQDSQEMSIDQMDDLDVVQARRNQDQSFFYRSVST